MNEELIRQCAYDSTGCPDHGWPNQAAQQAIRLYHARAVAPLAAQLTRPLIGIENRTAQEVFDIMCDRIRAALAPFQQEAK